jgi:hypothetical protein
MLIKGGRILCHVEPGKGQTWGMTQSPALRREAQGGALVQMKGELKWQNQESLSGFFGITLI